MQISLKWVNELINIRTVNLDELIKKLTLGGFEVEDIIKVEIDNTKTITLDISATANRSDSLSIQGFSLEIAALLNEVPKVSNYSTKNFTWFKQIKSLSENFLINNHCSEFIALTIENLNNVTSPKWLKQKLITSGLTPEDNLLDFQNYILLETGYPFECYDLNQINFKLNGSKFILKLTSETNLKTFTVDNDLNYTLDDSILILKANNLPIGIAGIIPSKEVNYSNHTNSLLIEGSIFNAAKIRQQSRILGLRTDRSSRYEKYLRNTNLLESFYRLIYLLRINNPDLICKLHTFGKPLEESPKIITLKYRNVKKILGPIKETKTNIYEYISPQTITNSLERLQFKTNYDKQNYLWEVTIPSLRMEDIAQEIDLIEEIGRIYGFNKFLTRLPNLKMIGIEDFHSQVRKKLTSCLVNLGLNELIQYSLENKKTYLKNEIELINPLIQDYSNLRSSLLPNLLKSVEENIKNGKTILEAFEYGHVFSRNSSKLIQERENIAGIFGGFKTKPTWSESSKLLNWFEAKGKIEQLFKKLNIITYWKSYTPIKEKDILHPYCTGEIYLTNNSKLGIFGQVNSIFAKQINISTDVYLFEFDFELIQNQIQINKLAVYHEYSLYPKIIKDLSFVIDNTISFMKLKKILYLNGSKFLTEINLLDKYYGQSIPENHLSLCLQLVFQSDKKTLQNTKIDMIVNNLKTMLTREFNVTFRI